MKHLRWLTPVFIILAVNVFIALDLVKIFSNPSDGILRSPAGLSLYPASLSGYQEIPYLSLNKNLERFIPAAEWINAVSPIFALSLVYVLTATFVYVLVRLRTLERTYFHLSIAVATMAILFLDYIAFKRFVPLFYYTSLFIVIPFTNFGLSLLGHRPSKVFSIGLSVLLIPFLFFIYPDSATSEKKFIVYMSSLHLLTFFYFIFIFLKEVLKKDNLRKDSKISYFLVVVLILSTGSIPVLFVLIALTSKIMNIGMNAIVFIPALFPMVFFIFGTRLGYLKFTVPISGILFRFSYFVFFTLLYWFTIGYHIMQIPYSEYQSHHFILIVLFLFLFEPLRTIFYTYFGRFFFIRRSLMADYLKQAAQTINNPRQITPFLDYIIRSVKNALQIEWASMHFSEDIFGDWTPSHPHVFLLPSDHPIWVQMRRWKKAQKYPSFTENIAGPIRELIKKNGGFLILSMQNYRMFLMISSKSGGEPIYGEEIDYLRNVMRHTEPLLENYRLLQNRVQLKRKEKELELAARIQRKIIPTHKEYPGIEFASVFSASEKVTGDYIDMIQTSTGQFRIFLGDVSGHGLGSAYLMSVVRAYIRGSSLVYFRPLKEMVEGLNQFLTENYRGSDFMTLFSIQIEKLENKFLLSYVNAGQHPSLIVYSDTGQAVPLGESQRVLGVVSTKYEEFTLDIRRPFRLYLYSDGAFEVFIEKGKILGERVLQQWIAETISMPPKEQLAEIVARIRNAMVDPDAADDISILCLVCKPTE